MKSPSHFDPNHCDWETLYFWPEGITGQCIQQNRGGQWSASNYQCFPYQLRYLDGGGIFLCERHRAVLVEKGYIW